MIDSQKVEIIKFESFFQREKIINQFYPDDYSDLFRDVSFYKVKCDMHVSMCDCALNKKEENRKIVDIIIDNKCMCVRKKYCLVSSSSNLDGNFVEASNN